MEQGAQIIELCTTNAQGVKSCIEQANGLMFWGSMSGTWRDGLAVMLAAYFSGFAVAAIRRVFGV